MLGAGICCLVSPAWYWKTWKPKAIKIETGLLTEVSVSPSPTVV